MIIINTYIKGIFKRRTVWFAGKPSLLSCINTNYKQSNFDSNVFGYVKEEFYTKVIDIKQTEEELMADFEKNTSYEVRRSVKDGVLFQIEENLDKFILFYNEFAKGKGLSIIGPSIRNYKNTLVITKALFEDDDLVMHSYVVDHRLKRVRLLHSASLYRNETDASRKAIIGRANRFLHLQDMVYFKSLGMETYDLGGYAFETNNQALISINKFKDGFGGIMIKEYDFWPSWVKWYFKLKRK